MVGFHFAVWILVPTLVVLMHFLSMRRLEYLAIFFSSADG